MSSNIFFKAQNISVIHAGITLLDNVSFDIKHGEIISVIGPNGGGKTTLARVLAGIIKPHQGKIIKQPALRIGYVPQHFYLNQLMPLKVSRFLQLSPYYNKQSITKLVEDLQMESIMDSQFAHLSGGEKQRVLMSRAMLGNPQLLVLDEPTQALDIDGSSRLYGMIDEYAKKENCAVVLISHDLTFVMSSTDKVLCLQHHICCRGTPQEINDDPVYKNLFGNKIANNLALYRHHHDHSHN